MNQNKILEKQALQKAASESEENRLRVNRIEHLEKNAKLGKLLVVMNALASGLYAITTLLYLKDGLTKDPKIFNSATIYLNAACSMIWGVVGRMNYKEKKRIDATIHDEKRKVLGYSK